MSVPKTLSAFFLFFLLATGAIAADERPPLHTSGDKTLYDRKLNKIDLIGNAAVHQNGESLYADHVTLEVDTKIVHAVGNVSFIGNNALIQAKEMHFNLETKTGTIVSGRVSTQNFTLSGERINKLGADRFQVYRGEYSTCRDCPQSWALEARDVDLELEGYAHLSNVTARIADAPALWIPYLIIPIKTKRQSGFLMPRFGSGTKGFFFVQPYFWATNRSVDMTFGLGTYGGRGRRLEWEGRYALKEGDGVANFWHLTDRTFRDYLKDRYFLAREGYSTNRWAAQVDQRQELPFGVFQKLRVRSVSDNLYPTLIGDVLPRSNPYLTSDFSLSKSTDSVSAYVYVSRYRNLLNLSNPDVVETANADLIQATNEDPRQFDQHTVQVFPQALLTTNDQLFLNNRFAAGVTVGVTEFTRAAGAFDPDRIVGDDKSVPSQNIPGYVSACPPGVLFCPGRDPIREATRVTVNPRLATTLRPFDILSVTPSLQYKHYFYNFNDADREMKALGQTGISTLNRGYLQFQTDLSTQIERIYETGDPNLPKMKHFIRPRLSYSLIPYRRQPNHPFVQQIDFARENNVTGYNFDAEDVVPLDASTNYTNYFLPLGHSLSYGFTSQLIRKHEKGGEVPTYERSLDWTAGQSVNFRELRKEPGERRPLSRVYTSLSGAFGPFTGYADYYYTPYQPQGKDTSRHIYSTSAKYVLEKGTRHRVLDFERSVQASYYYNRSSQTAQSEGVTAGAVYSLNDFIMPSFSMAYNVVLKRWQSAATTLAFQSPSQCWRLDLGLYQNRVEREHAGDKAWATTFQFNLSLNLTGAGFGGIPGAPVGAAGVPR